MWFAVPEDENGMWFGTPVGADTREEIVELATEEWTGKLPRGIEVVIYQATQVDVLDLPKQGEPTAPSPPPVPDRCPDTPDLFGDR